MIVNDTTIWSITLGALLTILAIAYYAIIASITHDGQHMMIIMTIRSNTDICSCKTFSSLINQIKQTSLKALALHPLF